MQGKCHGGHTRPLRRGDQGPCTLEPAAEFWGAPPADCYQMGFKNKGVGWQGHTEGA